MTLYYDDHDVPPVHARASRPATGWAWDLITHHEENGRAVNLSGAETLVLLALAELADRERAVTALVGPRSVVDEEWFSQRDVADLLAGVADLTAKGVRYYANRLARIGVLDHDVDDWNGWRIPERAYA